MLQPGVCDSADVANVHGSLLGVLEDGRVENSESGWQVKIENEEAPVFELFRDGEYGSPFAGRFRERSNLPAMGLDWARYEDGVSALCYIPGGNEMAPLIVMNMALSQPKSDWNQQANFVPFLAELLLNTRAVSRGGNGHAHLAGSVLRWQPGIDGDGGSVDLSAGEESMPVLRKKKEGVVFFESEEGAAPGVWRWQSGGREVARQIVNFPAEESDLRLLGDGESGGFQRAEGFERELALASGWALWPWLVFVAILFLIAESALVLWRPKVAGQMKGGLRS